MPSPGLRLLGAQMLERRAQAVTQAQPLALIQPKAPADQGTGGEDGLPAAPLSGEGSLGEPCYS